MIIVQIFWTSKGQTALKQSLPAVFSTSSWGPTLRAFFYKLETFLLTQNLIVEKGNLLFISQQKHKKSSHTKATYLRVKKSRRKCTFDKIKEHRSTFCLLFPPVILQKSVNTTGIKLWESKPGHNKRKCPQLIFLNKKALTFLFRN